MKKCSCERKNDCVTVVFLLLENLSNNKSREIKRCLGFVGFINLKYNNNLEPNSHEWVGVLGKSRANVHNNKRLSYYYCLSVLGLGIAVIIRR